MATLKRILVAVRDPLDPPQRALQKAADLARRTGAHLELFHAVSEFLASDAVRRGAREGGARPLLAGIAAARSAQLDRIARGKALRGVATSCHAAWDYPAQEAIVRRARQIEADLVVAESYPHRFGSRWFLTNTDWELIRVCPMPLLLARSARPYSAPRIVVALDPQHAHDKPGALDRTLLEVARRIARPLEGELHAAHAFLPLAMVVPSAAPMPTPTWVPQEAAEAHRRRIGLAFDRAASRGRVPPEHRHLLEGSAVSELERLTRRLRAGMLVIGAVSRSGLRRIFIGGTAERLLDHVSCDVLVVKPEGFRSPVPRTARRRGW